jgi:ABC-type branched-subunit amino acid transport system substrate-binding protein
MKHFSRTTFGKRGRGAIGIATAMLAMSLVLLASSIGTAASNAPVRIGIVFWTAGAAKDLGDVSANGALLAIEQINAAGGILGGRKLVGERYHEGYNAETVIISAKKAVSEGAVALVGGNDATTCVPLAQYAKQANVPVAITNCGTDETIKLGYEGLVHLRAPVTSGQSKRNALRALARWMLRVKKYKSVGAVSFDSQFNKNIDVEWSAYFKANAPNDFEYFPTI